MALLLRMGGVPARVATGFTTGSLDRQQNEYVVRDLDAHSWVEAWFPGYGWVTRDPTPAAAPARSQPGDETGIAVPTLGTAPDLGGDRPEPDPTVRSQTQDTGTPTTLIAAAVALAV